MGKRMGNWRARAILAMAAAVVGAGTVVRAGETWDGGTLFNDNRWTTAANWSPDGVPVNNGTAKIVMLGPLHTASAVNVPWSINTLTFAAAAPAFTLTGSGLSIGAGGIDNLSAATQTINNDIFLAANQDWNAASDMDFFGAIAGTSPLTKSGFGTMIFEGASANTYSGTTTVAGGLLQLNKSVANGAIAGDIVIGDPSGTESVALQNLASEQISEAAGNSVNVRSLAILDLNGFNETIRDLVMFEGRILTGAGTLTVLGTMASNASSTASSTISGKLSFAGGTRTITVADGAVATDLSIGAAISNGGLAKRGTGTLRMSGSTLNTYTGTTSVLEGVLELAKSITDGTIRGDLVIGDGTTAAAEVRLVGNEQFQASGGTVIVNSNGLFNLNGFSETINDMQMGGGQVSGGTLIIKGDVIGVAAASTAVIASNVSRAGVDGVFNIAAGTSGTDMDVSGIISNGGLIKNGAGVLMLSGGGANTYTGLTTVNEGTLVLNKTISDGAIQTSLVIGDGVGGASADVVRLARDQQIEERSGAPLVRNRVSILTSGLLDLANHVETIGDLNMTGGNITTGAAGLLTIVGVVTGNASSDTATISGRLAVNSGLGFDIADGPAVSDMDMQASIVSGSIVKNGPGLLAFTANVANTTTEPTVVNAGTLVLKKTVADGAVHGNLTIGGTGPADSVKVLLGANEQIAGAIAIDVTVNQSGLFDLDDHNETIANLALRGGHARTGTGTLTLTHALGTLPGASNESLVEGNVHVLGTDFLFVVDNGTAANDLVVSAVISGGSAITKTSPGRLRLTGANTFSGGLKLLIGSIAIANNQALGSGPLTINGATLDGIDLEIVAEGTCVVTNPVIVRSEIVMNTTSSLTLSGPLDSTSSIKKTGGGTLTISGPQSHSGNSVLGGIGLINLNSDAGTPATATTPATAQLAVNIFSALGLSSTMVLGSDQELRSLAIILASSPQTAGLNLNSPADAGAFRGVRIYASDLTTEKKHLYDAIVSANGPVAEPQNGIFDSGLAAHPGSKIGVAIVNDVHGDAHVLVRPTVVGDLNLDGFVSIADFIALASHFNQTNMTWQEGDVNYDTQVTIADFIQLATNFNTSYSGEAFPISQQDRMALASFAEAHGAAVPEPGMIALAGATMLGLGGRKFSGCRGGRGSLRPGFWGTRV